MSKRLLPFLLLLFSVAAFANDINSAAVDKVVQDTMKAWNIPGAAVTIVQNDRVVYAKGFGVKEVGKSDPVDADTLFGIASNTKAFTTAAMAILVDEKKMAWDDPVRKYVDYFHIDDPNTDELVTLRDLVCHRTGMGTHDELWDNSDLTREQVIRALAYIKPDKPIRTTYIYNNIMFMTAGEAVAAAAKMPWADFVRTRIFEPLGMKNSCTTLKDFYARDHAIGSSYDRAKNLNTLRPPDENASLGPAGVIKTSANDMGQWIRFQLNDGTIDGKRIASADALGETKTPQFALPMGPNAKRDNPDTNLQAYAMGWNVMDYRGQPLVVHGGVLSGFRSQVALLPNQHSGMFVVINSSRGLAGFAIRRAITDMVLGVTPRDWSAFYLAIDSDAVARAEKAKAEAEAKRPKDTKPTHELAAYAGTYDNSAYGPATISVDNGALVFHWQKLNIPMTQWAYDTFSAVSDPDDVDEKVQFRLAENGEVKSLTIFGQEFARK